MDQLTFHVDIELSEISSASIDSLRTQMEAVIAQAIEEKQLEIPDAEITDYGVTYDYGRAY